MALAAAAAAWWHGAARAARVVGAFDRAAAKLGLHRCGPGTGGKA
jgi:hypothetical protein